MPILTLTTDFGTGDYYVGAMKGVALGIAPHARLIDISHQIPPQDVLAAAFVLCHAAREFPPGTVHLAVVDPGVGTARRPIAVAAADQFWIGPDNGLFRFVLNNARTYHIANKALFSPRPSHTFHGRDIFAPIAAHLCSGLDLAEVGPSIADPVHLDHTTPQKSAARIEGLIANYELAFRLQSTMPAILSLDDETQETQKLYGIGQPATDNFGRQCLLARKFAERGVRYIQVTTNYTWDHHQHVNDSSINEAKRVDRPMAGLLQDLARRGLLDETLVVWGGEFGRTPKLNTAGGRDHWPRVFSVALAGAGIRGGTVVGSSDAVGESPRDRPVTPSELAATIYTLLGVSPDLELKTGDGRPVRLVVEGSEPISEVMTS